MNYVTFEFVSLSGIMISHTCLGKTAKVGNPVYEILVWETCQYSVMLPQKMSGRLQER